MTIITARLGRMRNEQVFAIMLDPDGENIIVESETAIGRFEPVFGTGVLNSYGRDRKSLHHLSAVFGGEAFRFPVAFVEGCKAILKARRIDEIRKRG